MGIFGRRKKEGQTQQKISEEVEPSTTEEAELLSDPAPTGRHLAQQGASSQQFEDHPGLYSVVEMMRSKGRGELTLELTQSGNDMNLRFHENGREKENTVVIPSNEWFDGVAQMYVDEKNNGRGAFNRALIVVTGNQRCRVQASFMNTEDKTSTNLQFSAPARETEISETISENVSTDSEVPTTFSAQDRLEKVSARMEQEETGDDSEDFESVAFGSSSRADTSVPGDTVEVIDEANPFIEEEDSAEEQTDSGLSTADETALSEELEESTDPDVSEYETEEEVQNSNRVTSAHDISLVNATLPAEIDEEWEATEERPGTRFQRNNVQEKVPSELPTDPVDTADVPDGANTVDVAPSFSTPEVTVEKPSTTRLAEGNLVLTEADVVQRLAGVQENLFGANGSARDVSTVLIRVRTLGSYYDALTHVRQDGFWNQKRTFDLIPEDELNILQLKADSYKEGFGSPLSISIRLTPGIPPQVEFNYEDEAAFAKYSDELPAQQYVEELRMFPRTGANIPESMSRALASWTL